MEEYSGSPRLLAWAPRFQREARFESTAERSKALICGPTLEHSLKPGGTLRSDECCCPLTPRVPMPHFQAGHLDPGRYGSAVGRIIWRDFLCNRAGCTLTRTQYTS